MEDILKTFLVISLAASAMICIVLIIRMLFSKKMNPAIMLILWGMVLVRLCFPLTIESPVTVAGLFPEQADSINTTDGAEHLTDPSDAYSSAGENTGLNNIITETVTQIGQTSAETEHGKQVLPTGGILKDIPVWSVLTAVWLIGIALTLCLFMIKVLRFRKKLRICDPVIDERVLEIIKIHKNAAGVRNSITALECDFIHAPAVFGYFKPRILIPSRFLKQMGTESLSAILLHEVCHISCHDILKNYIWLTAKALHWFNPLVWIAYKRYETDVEISRDGKAALLLSADGAEIFSKSLLDAAWYSRQDAVSISLLAAPLFESKNKLKERILRLMNPDKKTKSAIVVSALLAMLMFVTCFTTACQAVSANKPAAAEQKGNQTAATAAAEAFIKIEAPVNISETDEPSQYVNITYDTDVTVPDTTSYPVAEVTKRAFSNDDILSWVKLFAGNNTDLYSEWNLTKAEYQSLFDGAKQNEASGIVTYDLLGFLQEMSGAAPEQVNNPKIGSLSDVPNNKAVYVKTGDDTAARFSFARDGNNFSYTRSDFMETYVASQLGPDQFSANMGDTVERFTWLKPGDPEISQQDAYGKAADCMEEMNIDLDLYTAEPCSVITNYVNKTTGWKFTFTRKISNLQASDDAGGFFISNNVKPSATSPWGVEKLTITVDKEGVCNFWWRGASELSAAPAGSVQLLDFDTIRQNITSQLNLMLADGAKEQNIVFDIKIMDIRLGISMITAESSTDAGQYIPTWYVTYRLKTEKESYDTSELQQIMFSAIDGSYIEPRSSN